MNRPADGRRPNLALVLLLGLSAAAAGVYWSSPTDSSETWRVVTSLSQAPIGDGRFFRATDSPFDPARYQEALEAGALQLITDPDSPSSLRIRALMNVGNGNISAAAETLRQLIQKYPGDAEVLNDLGVVYMAMGKENASKYFLAADLFERSRRLTIHAAAPNYNSAAVYRKLELNELAAERLNEYQSAKTEESLKPDPLALLKAALDEQDTRLATELLRGNLPVYRQASFDRLLNPQEPITDEVTKFVFDHYRNAGTDPTIELALAPLGGPSRNQIVESRKHIARGIAAYQKGKLDEAWQSYDLAEAASAKSGSLFDDLWLNLNRADVWLRKGEKEEAGELLDAIISESRRHQYNWLLGKALAAKSSDPRLSGNFEESLKTLNEAADTLNAIDSPHDESRALNYFATLYFFAGDFEKSLDFAYRAFFTAPKSDHLHRAQPLVIAAIQVYRLGLPAYANLLGEKALLEAKAANNAGIVAHASSNLAILQSLERKELAAESNFAIARTASAQIESPFERSMSQLSISLLCARVMTDRGNLSEAEKCLQQNLRLLNSMEEGKVPYYVVQTLLQLSKIHQLQGRFDLAHENLQEAADVLEMDDAYLSAGPLRLAFENERRNFYENAIGFEYDHGSKDTAWQHVQRYRSKLFLEFLGEFNPNIKAIQSAALDRSKVQQLIPPKVQVVEYVVLPDRLLIWLVSNNSFISTTVPVTRAELERKIADFLRRSQDSSNEEFKHQAQELYRILIEPIENRIGPTDTLAIIPDQALHRLNFPALYSQARKSYLIERYPILENPSLASLLSEGAMKPSRDNAFAFGAQMDDTNATAELAALEKYYAGIQSFNGPKALKSAFLSSLESAGMFHFAGHSQDASNPLRSSVLLDGRTEGSNSITAADITKHRMLPNSVVVLASCDSSVGNSRDGVSMRGLTSAFLISGAGSVVGSLWLVEAGSTSRLVLGFHKGFAQDNLSVAESLRKAQLKFIADKVHPYYWSGFVVTGNLSALR